MLDKRPVGVFDSGVGGLTVLRELVRALPGEDFIYIGDTARVPYGNKSKKTIIRFSTENVRFLLGKKVKCIVVACNTATSLALDRLKKDFRVPLLGVIDAAVDKALEVSGKGRIGVIGTASTISSKVYEKKIKRKSPRARVYQQACPLFVPFAEEGMVSGRIISQVVEMYLQPLRGKVDTLILGCTHYPLLKKVIATYLKGVYLIDSAREVALDTRALLENNGMRSPGRGRREFYVTDEPVRFSEKARLFLGDSRIKPKVVNV